MVDQPEIRVGDRERYDAERRLRDAYGQGALDLAEFEDRLERTHAAKTRGDLAPLLTDLPPATHDEPSTPHSPAPTGQGRPTGWIVVGVIVVAALIAMSGGVSGVSIFGSSVVTPDVDLQDDDVESVRVVSLFGSTQVVVSDEVSAANDIIAAFGSSSCEQVCSTGEPDLRVTGLSLFGSVEILPASRLDE